MSGKGKLTILCVDDYASILVGWQTLLEAEGYNVLCATNWKIGLQLFSSHPVDEVILDYQMPEMMGNDLAAHMKEIKPDVPILLVSGDGSLPADKLKPVDGFLPKAVPAPVFLAMVKKLFNASRRCLVAFRVHNKLWMKQEMQRTFLHHRGSPELVKQYKRHTLNYSGGFRLPCYSCGRVEQAPLLRRCVELPDAIDRNLKEIRQAQCDLHSRPLPSILGPR